MTITFENENDVIVYALEKIISYARKHQYIFVAQSVWWIASVIGLTEGLGTHIDNLRIRRDISVPNHFRKEKVIEPQDLSGCYIPEVASGYIHPERTNQVDKRNNDNLEVGDSDLELDQASLITQSANRFINNSRKERKALERKPCVLSRTRSGKVPTRPLTKKQRSRLQAIPKDTLCAYLAGKN